MPRFAEGRRQRLRPAPPPASAARVSHAPGPGRQSGCIDGQRWGWSGRRNGRFHRRRRRRSAGRSGQRPPPSAARLPGPPTGRAGTPPATEGSRSGESDGLDRTMSPSWSPRSINHFKSTSSPSAPMHSPVHTSRFQSMMLRSSAHVSRICGSWGMKAAPVTGPTWPSREKRGSPEASDTTKTLCVAGRQGAT